MLRRAVAESVAAAESSQVERARPRLIAMRTFTFPAAAGRKPQCPCRAGDGSGRCGGYGKDMECLQGATAVAI